MSCFKGSYRAVLVKKNMYKNAFDLICCVNCNMNITTQTQSISKQRTVILSKNKIFAYLRVSVVHEREKS